MDKLARLCAKHVGINLGDGFHLSVSFGCCPNMLHDLEWIFGLWPDEVGSVDAVDRDHFGTKHDSSVGATGEVPSPLHHSVVPVGSRSSEFQTQPNAVLKVNTTNVLDHSHLLSGGKKKRKYGRKSVPVAHNKMAQNYLSFV